MKTPFDIASILLFAVIAIAYLHRSAQDRPDRTPMWAYAAVAAACAVGDVVANRGAPGVGAALLVAAILGVAWIVFYANRTGPGDVS